MNLFDIIGPVMVGPSSSHTAGAVRIGLISRKLLGEEISSAEIGLYGSFFETGKGHGTRQAIVAGLLGLAFTIKSMLGLVCDPVCGLVEVPCIKRNVSGAMLAISASQLALAGIESAIPTDEVIDAMRRVGEQIPECLRETARGGLATTETATKLSEQLKS